MTRKKNIIISSVAVILAAGTAAYFLFWRKRKSVTKEDAAVLAEYQVTDDPGAVEEKAGSDTSFKKTFSTYFPKAY